MPLLRHLAVLLAFVAAFVRPAPASAFAPASSETRVGGFEVTVQLLVGELGAASYEQHQGIGAAYDENASGYRFAAGGGGGRAANKLRPDPAAQGPHTTFKRDPQTGRVTGHAEWDAAGNPVKRTDVTGAAHGPVKTPHTHEYGPPNVDPASGKSYPGNQVNVRPATPDEIPR
jgi:hypothetical protein